MEHTTVVTGAASGLGRAVVDRVRASGRHAVGIDRHGDVEIIADLSTPDGVDHAVSSVQALDHGIGSVVSCAGLSPIHPDAAQIVAVNWFAAVSILERLADDLAATGGTAVAISSIGAAIGGDDTLEATLLATDRNDPDAVIAACNQATETITAYSTCKKALAKWVRQQSAPWGALGVRLNAVAPGWMDTPMLDGLLADPDVAPGIQALPTGLARAGSAAEIAATVDVLLGPDASFVHGQVLYVDGGSEAILRPDQV